MNFLTPLISALDDRLPPIVVKEARQAVRSRFVVSVQFLFLAILVIVLGTVLLWGHGDGTSRDLGRNVFFGFYGLLHAMTVLCVPLYVGARMAAERNDSNVDLLFSTTIAPWSVVVGKLVSGLMVGMLTLSACAPFLVLCYFLRGVALETIVAGLLINLGVLGICTLLAVFIGALPVGPVIKVIAALIYLALALVSIYLLLIMMAMSTGGFFFGGGGPLFSLPASPSERVAWVVSTLLGLGVCGLLFVMTTAMLAPATSNRALPVRLYLTLMWGLSAMIAVLINFALISSGFKFFAGWAAFWSILLALAALVAGSERDRLGPRVLAQIPRHPKGNMGAFLLYSGSAGGLFWVGCMTFGTLVFSLTASYMLDWLFTRRTGADVSGMRSLVLRLGVSNAMVIGYVLLAGCLRRRFWAGFTRPVHTGFLAVGLMAAAFVGPVILAFVLGNQGDGGAFWSHVSAPFALFLTRPHDEDALAVLICSAVVALAILIAGLLWSLPWAMPQVRVFYSKPMSPDAHEPRAQARGAGTPPLAASPELALRARERKADADSQTGGGHV